MAQEKNPNYRHYTQENMLGLNEGQVPDEVPVCYTQENGNISSILLFLLDGYFGPSVLPIQRDSIYKFVIYLKK